MSQMRAAFAKAGYHSSAETWPSEELLAIAEKAMIAHADDLDACLYAIFTACCPLGSLAHQLFVRRWRDAANDLLKEFTRRLKAKQLSETRLSTRERRVAKVISLREEREAAHQSDVRRHLLETRTEAQQQHAVVVEEWLTNKARNLLIDDRHWWLATPTRARQWNRRGMHEHRFIDLVLEGMPEDDQRPISHYLRPHEVNKLWDLAWGNDRQD